MPTEPSRVRRQIGEEIKRLRLTAGLPIRGFENPPGGMTPVANARVQRAEKGTAFLNDGQLHTILELTGADPDTRERLSVMLTHALSEHIRWDAALDREDAPHLQLVAGSRERAASSVSVFEHAFLPGLLQTPAYAAALLPLFGLPQDDEAATTARIARQDILYERGRQFRFVFTERTLRWAQGSEVSMQAQYERITAVAGLDAVMVRVLPESARQPMNGFSLYEGMTDGTAMVAIELEHGELPLADPREVTRYHDLFETLFEQSRAIE